MAANDPKINIKIDADGSGAKKELESTMVNFDAFNNKVSKTKAQSTARAATGSIEEAEKKIGLEYQGLRGAAKIARAKREVTLASEKGLAQEAAKTYTEAYMALIEKAAASGKLTPALFARLSNRIKPFNEDTIKDGRDKGLQNAKTYISTISEVKDARLRRVSEALAKETISKSEFDRQSMIVMDGFHKQVLAKARDLQATSQLTPAAASYLGKQIKPIDPAKLKLARDEGYRTAEAFVKGQEEATRLANSRFRFLHMNTNKQEKRELELSILKDHNRAIAEEVSRLRKVGELSDAALNKFAGSLKPIKGVDANQLKLSRDDGYRTAEAFVKGQEDATKALISSSRLLNTGGDRKARLEAERQILKDHNKAVMEEAGKMQSAGILTEAALNKLSGSLKTIVEPVDKSRQKVAHDEGYKIAEAFIKGQEEATRKRVSSFRLQNTGADKNAKVQGEMSILKDHNKAIAAEASRLQASGKLTESALNKLAGSLKNLKGETTGAGVTLRQFRQGMFDLFAVTAAVQVGVGLWAAAFGSIKQFVAGAAEVAGMEAVGNAFVTTMGQIKTSADEALPALREATRGAITDQELFKVSNLAVSLQATRSKEDLEKLMFAGTVLGRAMGQDAKKGIEDLTIAIGRQSTRVLDNLGIYLRVETAQRIYASRLRKNKEDLTNEEKARAFATIALEEAEKRAKFLAGTAESGAMKVEKFAIQIENLKNKTMQLVYQTDGVGNFFDMISKKLDEGEGKLLRYARAVASVTTDSWALFAKIPNAFGSGPPEGVQTRSSVDKVTDVSMGLWEGVMGAPDRNRGDAWRDVWRIGTGRDDDDRNNLRVQYEAEIAAFRTQMKQMEEEFGKESEVYKQSENYLSTYIKNRESLIERLYSNRFLDRRSPLAPPLLPTMTAGRPNRPPKPKPTDEEEDKDKDPYKKLRERISGLITIYDEYLRKGQETSRVVAALRQAQGELAGAVAATTGEFGQQHAQLLTLSRQVQEALSNLPFDHFERLTRSGLKAYSAVHMYGQSDTQIFRELEASLTRVQTMLRSSAGLTREVRDRASDLRNDLVREMIDVPMQAIERSVSFNMTQLSTGMRKGWDLESTYEIIDALGVKLMDLRKRGAGLNLLQPGDVEKIQQLMDRIEESRQSRLYARVEYQGTVFTNLLTAQRELFMGAEASIAQLSTLYTQVQGMLALVAAGTLRVTPEQLTKLLQLSAQYKEAIKPAATVNTERDMGVDIIRVRAGERAATAVELQRQVEDYRKMGVDRVLIEQWASAKIMEARREEWMWLKDAAKDALSQIATMLGEVASGTKEWDQGIKDVAKSFADMLGGMMIERGMTELYNSILNIALASKSAAQGTAAVGAAGAAMQNATGTASSGLQSAGAMTLAANPMLGVGLLAGGMLLNFMGGALGGSSKEREEEQYRAHLKALRQSRDDQFMVFNLHLPSGFIDPNNRQWQEALAETMEAASGNRIGRVNWKN